ncbi:MAG: multifunctional oxoglutarate decarboxylase/oxoglutarate dehydrogenase thiamine pyrophosphate-binding subunit/dihydrolipoyllysine-residue succinyltransferase subunit [Planctomycetota bacterium]|nr:multifunctional oxoglutarate decarboxylase/oxoglutarate dehydrogenase thiamine pyrophosphate-binding subunit/dihydrolipoyllysine-residue succinyltransferase subunit [Planctomycetota bacterium]
MDRFGSNSGYVDALFEQFKKDPTSVSTAWQEFFVDYQPQQGLTHRGPSTKDPSPGSQVGTGSFSRLPAETHSTPELTSTPPTTTREIPKTEKPDVQKHESSVPLKGIAGRIVENMEQSLEVPTATTVRTLAVRLLEENRKIVNEHQVAWARSKVSFTHLIAWAIVKALRSHPGMNHGFQRISGEPHRIVRSLTRLGIAVDVERRGARSLVVPNLRDTGQLDFREFLAAFNDVVSRARSGKLILADFEDTSVSITNPGMLGTSMSVPRLMTGQGAIIGIGAIDYPPSCAGMADDVVSRLGLSKVMTLTSSYDHRVIQGAESGAFLATVEQLLLGNDRFYELVFEQLDVPHEPYRWSQESNEDEPNVDGNSPEYRQAKVLQLVEAYRSRGHRMAHLDPLGNSPAPDPELELSSYGLSIWDLDRSFICGGVGGQEQPRKLREILDILRRTYTRYVGVEVSYISDSVERDWLQQKMEANENSAPLDLEEKLHILRKLNEAEAFEKFLHTSYVGHKRFSLEGCESLIPALDALLDACSTVGVEDVMIGMAHRGRLNVLVNILGKPLEQVFEEFEDFDMENPEGSGDVKYHLGAQGFHRGRSGNPVKVTLASNPSHLESVGPVVEGMVRALQDDRGRCGSVVPLLIHGDAALAGQGVTYETLNMSQLPGYTTQGTIHVVINNQIGFTTSPEDGRSSRYCTDVAKTVEAPVFHVNADHPQMAVRMIGLAFEYRTRFGKDVFIDLIGYRRWGHNEGDEPSFTQPMITRSIEEHRSVRKLTTERLLARGEIDIETAEQMLGEFQSILDGSLQKVKASLTERTSAQVRPDLEETEGIAVPSVDTSIPIPELDLLLAEVTRTPDQFNLHPKLQKQFERRLELARGGAIDWGLAELCAFGSLVREGTSIRLSGEDCGRGTFSQRHSVLRDGNRGTLHVPLQHLPDSEGSYQVYDSLLSEFGVLGFEFGYSLQRPSTLTIWEAQFGDFCNGAQVIIDQFISSSEEKWNQSSGLTMLLPHGYEGQGPEHSSSRLERFLQLCAEGNMRVVQPSTPAQYFHILRRQVHEPKRKPLVVLTPKSLLRLPAARSTRANFTADKFQETIVDGVPGDGIRTLLIASGRVIYDLLVEREKRSANDVLILRLEQLYPFPRNDIQAVLADLPKSCDVRWIQDEPRNMGAWSFLRDRDGGFLGGGRRVRFIGRAWSASPASGSKAVHEAEQAHLIERAFADEGSDEEHQGVYPGI